MLLVGLLCGLAIDCDDLFAAEFSNGGKEAAGSISICMNELRSLNDTHGGLS